MANQPPPSGPRDYIPNSYDPDDDGTAVARWDFQTGRELPPEEWRR